MSRALELVYRADILSAPEALEAGLVHSVPPFAWRCENGPQKSSQGTP